MPFDVDVGKPFDVVVKDNVELLCDAIAKGEGFTMATHGECGSPGCIAGWATHLWPEIQDPYEPDDLQPDEELLAAKLGVDQRGLNTLCYHYGNPTAWDETYPDSLFVYPCDEINRNMAIAALRRLRDTGEAYFSLKDQYHAV